MHIHCGGGRHDEAEGWDECGTHCIVCRAVNEYSKFKYTFEYLKKKGRFDCGKTHISGCFASGRTA